MTLLLILYFAIVGGLLAWTFKSDSWLANWEDSSPDENWRMGGIAAGAILAAWLLQVFQIGYDLYAGMPGISGTPWTRGAMVVGLVMGGVFGWRTTMLPILVVAAILALELIVLILLGVGVYVWTGENYFPQLFEYVKKMVT